MPTPAGEGVFVVGVGASAGGLEALEAFFANLPSAIGAAFVVVQHLSPNFDSLMDQLLRRHTRLSVTLARDGAKLLPEKVFLSPPGTELTVQEGVLRVRPQREHRHPPLAIDVFFESLAREFQEHAIAVILSGSGSDGSSGVRAVKHGGGVVLVQEPATAQFDGMPNAALRTGACDLVLPPAAMGHVIQSYVNASLLPLSGSALEVDPSVLRRVFDILESRTRIDFGQYRDKTVFRRLGRRMSIVQCSRLEDFADRLAASDEEIDALVEDLLIGVTEFFRDQAAFESLASELSRATAHHEDGVLRVWVPGCSTGEEAYSIAMTIEELSARSRRPLDYKIFATDPNRRSLAHASEGVYGPGIVDRLGRARVERFFQPVDRGFRIAQAVRSNVVFAAHDLIVDPPFTRMHVVTCRNVLIYLERPAQERVLRSLSFALRPGGLLLLGPSESVGASSRHYETLDSRWKLFRRRASVADSLESQADPAGFGRELPRRAVAAGARTWFDLERICERILSQFVTACVVTDEAGLLLHSFGEPNRYLRMTAGRASLQLAQMLPVEARSFVLEAMEQAKRTGKPARCKALLFRVQGPDFEADVTVHRLSSEDGPGVPGGYVVGFGAPSGLTRAHEYVEIDSASASRIEVLERDLEESRKHLSATIEELEGSNEELQSTNEELLASNEELQSTNEELHSVNEELYTVNAEHQRKIQELIELSADMENLLESIDVGTVFLDRQLLIRKFTPQAKEMVRLVASDVGRPLRDLTHGFPGVDLDEVVQRVLREEKPVEFECDDFAGRPRLVRVLPYRAGEDVTGAVITALDVSAIHEARRRLVQSERQFALLVQNLEQVFWLARRDVPEIEYLSPYVTELLGLPAQPSTETARLWLEAIHPDDRDRVAQQFAAATPEQPFDVVFRVFDMQGQLHWLHSRGVAVRHEPGSEELLAGLAWDITEHKRLELLLEEQLRHRKNGATVDAETGLENALGLEHALAREIARTQNPSHRVALLHFALEPDADDDAAAAGAALSWLSDLASRTVRRCDVLARTGPQELAILLPNYERTRGLLAARAIEDALARHPGPGRSQSCRLRIGIAELPLRVSAVAPALEALRGAAKDTAGSDTQGEGVTIVCLDEGEQIIEHARLPEPEEILPTPERLRCHTHHDLRTDAEVARELRPQLEDPLLPAPQDLVAYCSHRGILRQLDLRTFEAALHSQHAREDTTLLIPVHPSLLDAEGTTALLRRHDEAAPAARVRLLLATPQLHPSLRLGPQVEALRRAGLDIALDDVGLGETPLEALLDLRPALLRYARSLTLDLARRPEARGRLRRLQDVLGPLVPVTCAWAETAEDAAALRELGIDWA